MAYVQKIAEIKNACRNYKSRMFLLEAPQVFLNLNRENMNLHNLHPDTKAFKFLDLEWNYDFHNNYYDDIVIELTHGETSVLSTMQKAWRRNISILLLSMKRYANSPGSVVLPLEMHQLLLGFVLSTKSVRYNYYNPIQRPRVPTRDLVTAFPYLLEKGNVENYAESFSVLLAEYEKNLTSDPMLTVFLYMIQGACVTSTDEHLTYKAFDMLLVYLENKHAFSPVGDYERKMPLIALLYSAGFDEIHGQSNTRLIGTLLLRCATSSYCLCSDSALYLLFQIYYWNFGQTKLNVPVVWDIIIGKAQFVTSEPSCFKHITFSK